MSFRSILEPISFGAKFIRGPGARVLLYILVSAVAVVFVAAQMGYPGWLSCAGVVLLLSMVMAAAWLHGYRQARETESWRGQVQNLHEFTRRTLQMNLTAAPGQQLAELVQEIFTLESVAVFDADLHTVYQAGYGNADLQEMAQNVYYFETSDDDADTGLGRRVVRLGTAPVGSLVVRGGMSPLTNDAIASLIAITFDRYRALANESRIEAERQTEQLRSTVLDSLAHAYKTPLTAIRAASTGLGEMGHLSAGQADLVALIDEQTSRLSELTTRLLTTARLDAGEVSIHATRVGVGALIDEVLASLKDCLASMKVSVVLEDEDMVLNCDRRLIITLLSQYLDNACKYSIYGTDITIRAVHAKGEVIFSVNSYGPIIPMADRERIFDRYYRSSAHSDHASGTGIGLSVAKRVAVIHGGYVWVTSDETAGTTFFAAIPDTVQEGSTE